jgi:outer membrane protein assembly factor BamB
MGRLDVKVFRTDQRSKIMRIADRFKLGLVLLMAWGFGNAGVAKLAAQQTATPLPSYPMKFGAFVARFDPGGTFTLQGQGWPALNGNWKSSGNEVELQMSGGPGGCDGPGRYQFRVDSKHVTFTVVSDDCRVRQIILDKSDWAPADETRVIPARTIARTAGARASSRVGADSSKGSWPSFRGAQASGIAEGQNLPDRWNGKTGENILWRTPIPGLAHSSPVVWGNRVFVTSAVSSDPKATFRPGLYGDGDASKDRSVHRWIIYAIDKRSGKIAWERVAHQGEPLEKRHIKATYANSTPATDGRMVVAWFGSQGVHAYDVNGKFLWKVDLGRVDMGAYDIPTYEWGPASSPIIWNDLVIIQCDTQADSFLLALDAATGKTVWKTVREELPSWGTPTVVQTSAGPQLVTNASNFIRAYDPRTGKELWRLGRSSKITAPTPIIGEDLIVVASGRGPERPIFVVRPNAQGDVTLAEGKTTSETIAWSRTGRGSYMPTPLIYRGLLYVLANNGTFDAYNLKTGDEVYRQRLPTVGSGFSASPVASDGKIYLSNEDGEILVIGAGDKFTHLATNSMGELLMATPALSEGVMYVRSAQSLFAIGRKL